MCQKRILDTSPFYFGIRPFYFPIKLVSKNSEIHTVFQNGAF